MHSMGVLRQHRAGTLPRYAVVVDGFGAGGATSATSAAAGLGTAAGFFFCWLFIRMPPIAATAVPAVARRAGLWLRASAAATSMQRGTVARVGAARGGAATSRPNAAAVMNDSILGNEAYPASCVNGPPVNGPPGRSVRTYKIIISNSSSH